MVSSSTDHHVGERGGVGAVEERQVEERQLSLQPLDQSPLQAGHVGRHARLRAARQQAVNEERLAQLLQSSGSWLFPLLLFFF